MAKPTVEQRDIVILQRDPGNAVYEEIHISGSNLILLTDGTGDLTATRRDNFSSSWASSSISSSYNETGSSLNFIAPTIPALSSVTLQGYVQTQIAGAYFWLPYYSSP